MIKKPYKKKRRLIFLSALMIIFLLGGLWQDYMTKKEAAKFPPKGELYNINGHSMHLYGIGAGDATVVFITGSGTPCAFTDFYALQNELQQYARTVSFDHAGFGWSETTEKPRTIDVLVDELHELLEKSRETPPYILVGHSLSSLEVMHFAQKYPDEVKGIVLIDGGNPYYYAGDSELKAISINRLGAFFRTTGIIRALGNIGVVLPFYEENLRYNSLPEDIKKLDLAMYYKNVGNKSSLPVIKKMNENAGTVIDGGYLEDTPLIILSSDSGKAWEESQQQLLQWSNISCQETISKAAHYIHWTHKDIVIDKILELINKC